MSIILEGPDGGGKTTLGLLLAEHLGMEHKPSEGPEKYPGEINERIRRYALLDDVRFIYDRHPCVSQVAYAVNVHSQTMPDEDLLKAFYDRDDQLIIYCRPPENMPVNHTQDREWDTADYTQAINKNYDKLLAWYDAWALRRAHIIYRMGNMQNLHLLLKGVFGS